MTTHSKDLQVLANLIKSGNKKIIFMVGAGISTSAGIPDFRSPETGLYNNLQKLKIPYAEAVFDIEYFKKNPRPFYCLAQELYPGQFLPTRFHFLMKLFQDKKLLHRVYTQNIDTLERVAGVEDQYIIEAHGSFAENHCIVCSKQYPNDLFKAKIFEKKTPVCLHCSEGLVKPDIVFFGEGLPEKFFSLWEKDSALLDEADTEEFITITAGTSLSVFPFASLPSEIPRNQKRVLVNKERVGDFKASPRKSDMLFIEASDEFTDSLVELLGWSTELDNLIESAKAKLSKENKTSTETAEEKNQEIAEVIKEELDAEENEKKEVGDLTQEISQLKLEPSTPTTASEESKS